MKDRWGNYILITGHEGGGYCWWCGGEFPDRRPRRYCSEACRDQYYQHFRWPDASRWALERAHHKCQRCGMSLKGLISLSRISYFRRLSYPDIYRLEAHHLDPLAGAPRIWSIKNMPSNLQVLCVECHHEVEAQKRHKEANDRKQNQIKQTSQLALPLWR